MIIPRKLIKISLKRKILKNFNSEKLQKTPKTMWVEQKKLHNNTSMQKIPSQIIEKTWMSEFHSLVNELSLEPAACSVRKIRVIWISYNHFYGKFSHMKFCRQKKTLNITKNFERATTRLKKLQSWAKAEQSWINWI